MLKVGENLKNERSDIRKNDNLKKILNDRESTIKTMEMKLNKENNINNNI